MAKNKNSESVSCEGPYGLGSMPLHEGANLVAIGFYDGKPRSMVCQHFEKSDKTCSYVSLLGTEQEGFEYLPCLILKQLSKKKA